MSINRDILLSNIRHRTRVDYYAIDKKAKKLINLAKQTRFLDRKKFIQFLNQENLIEKYSKCVVCGWDKDSIDLCHRLPVNGGGRYEVGNIIPLCPNCHRLFDKNKLDEIDLEKIDLFLGIENIGKE